MMPVQAFLGWSTHLPEPILLTIQWPHSIAMCMCEQAIGHLLTRSYDGLQNARYAAALTRPHGPT